MISLFISESLILKARTGNKISAIWLLRSQKMLCLGKDRWNSTYRNGEESDTYSLILKSFSYAA